MNELIRRDKAIEIAEFYATHGWPEDQIGNIAEEIKKIDTVDAKAVRHGRWIDTGMNNLWGGNRAMQCSGCGQIAGRMNSMRYKYCPRCGAKMDEVTE